MINTIVSIQHVEDFPEQGFYSQSYLAFDQRLGRHVAVKDIIYQNLTSLQDFEKYFEEAYKLSISSHPRVLPVYYVGVNHDTNDIIVPRIVTNYFKNGSLNSYLKSIYSGRKTLALDEIIRYSHDIIQGMIHLHSLDIVHLDLKASNIYISDDLRMVIGDFGQSMFIKDGIINNPVNLYPATAPIEYAEKKSIDKTTDIYQFGLLLYSMICYDKYRNALENEYKIHSTQLIKIYRENSEESKSLKKEFYKAMGKFTEDIKNKLFPDRNFIPYYIPGKLFNIIDKCLSPSVEDRYNNFYQIQTDLNDFVFPCGVTNFYQNLETNVIHFVKEEKLCEIIVEQSGSMFTVISKKNGRAVNACKETDLSAVKMRKAIFKFAKEL